MSCVQQQFLQSVVELPIGERFAEKAIRAFFDRLHRGGLVGERRDDEYQHLGIDRHQLLNALDAVHFRHRQIHGHNVRPSAVEQLNRLAPVARRPDDLQSIDLLRTLDAPANDVRIIDDHQFEGRLRSARSVHHAASVTLIRLDGSGRDTEIRVNLPGRVPILTRPPASRTRSAIKFMPMPLPPSLVTRSAIEKPAWNSSESACLASMLSACAALINPFCTAVSLMRSVDSPIPSSSIVSLYAPGRD